MKGKGKKIVVAPLERMEGSIHLVSETKKSSDVSFNDDASGSKEGSGGQ